MRIPGLVAAAQLSQNTRAKESEPMLRSTNLIATLFALAVAATADAQAPAEPGRPITITVRVSQHAGPPLYLRTATTQPRNVVLVNPQMATAVKLSDAIRGLLWAEAEDPEGLERSDTHARATSFDPPDVYPWAQAMLDRLRRATESSAPETINLPVPRLVRPDQPPE